MQTKTEKKIEIGFKSFFIGSTLLGATCWRLLELPYVWMGVVVGGFIGLFLSVIFAIFILAVFDLATDISSLYKWKERE